MASPETLIMWKGISPLYLQQDHQQFLIVPGSVTADVALQLGTEVWEQEERGEKIAYNLCSQHSLMAAIDPSRLIFVSPEDLLQQQLDSFAKRQ